MKCKLADEDGECPSQLEPAWCTRCNGRDEAERKAAKLEDKWGMIEGQG